ncbi:MAG: NADH-quinone oxidoreductase subunit L [Nitriliruptorales bacterium]
MLAPVLLAVEAAAGLGIEHAAGATGVARAAWLVPALPLLGFVVLVLTGSRLRAVAGWIATALAAGSFAVAAATFLQLTGLPEGERALIAPVYTWLDVGDLTVRADLLLDPLSVTMILVVTGVGSLIHLYSIGYMRGDPREQRYFAYLNLFLFSMLVLVLGADLLVLFVGWELVGLCSYLLIGFWFEEWANAVAAKKAMVVNRLGDVSFAIGIFLVFTSFGTLAFPDLLPAAEEVLGGRPELALGIGLLLLGGAVGKSAQIPLYVWLPDAMAGPTPVSALIHAATMVTAGVYMVARLSPVYVASAGALEVVAWIGMATALLAALIAVQQDDIKRVLAYSTISQLGYMFAGVGVAAFGAGVFHLVTHAFFKALLFLAAGSMMHAVANRTDMWEMGGLRRAMPVTFWTSVVAVLAISGVPPFAGFFSKDQILTAAFDSGHVGIWVLGVATVAVTGFYMTRWLVVPFLGEPRRSDVHPHESPPTMTVPLVALAGLSVVGGFLNPVHGGFLDRWLGPSVAHVEEAEGAAALPEAALIAISIVVALAGIGAAWLVYRGAPASDPLPARVGALAGAMRRRFYVDDLYERIFVDGGGIGARAVVWFDDTVIDGAVNGVGRATRTAASGLRVAQPGLVRLYVAGVVVGTIVVVGAFLSQVVGT